MTGQETDLGEAIGLFLANFPGNNEAAFTSRYPDESVEKRVRAILLETSRVQIEWGDKTLIEIGREVREIMHSRHPELTDPALRKLGNYFTYLMR